MLDVSVIILSYNVQGLLKDCLNSLIRNSTGLDYEVIAVDNASSDNSQSWLKAFSKTKHPANLKKIQTFLLSENVGFCKGNNVGIKASQGKYVLLLNPDTKLIENSLKKMFLWMEDHPQVGASSCQLLNSQGRVTPTGGYFPTISRLILWALFLDDLPFIGSVIHAYHPYTSPLNKRPIIYEKQFFPDWIIGAFFFARKDAINNVGLLDEKIFLYADDLEWCLRFKAKGWQIAYTPITRVFHLERQSSKGISKNSILGEFRGLRYIYQKYSDPVDQIISNIILNLAAILRTFLWLARREPDVAKTYLQTITHQ